MLSPFLLEIVQTPPKWCNPPFNLEIISQNISESWAPHTINCRTVGLLKSSVPVYTPIVTKYPPSTCSSFILRSRSFSRATRSFSSFRASLSCFVSLRSGCSGLVLLDPIPKNDRSGLLPLPPRTVYTAGLGDVGPLPGLVVRPRGFCESGPRDSLELLLPILQSGLRIPRQPDQLVLQVCSRGKDRRRERLRLW